MSRLPLLALLPALGVLIPASALHAAPASDGWGPLLEARQRFLREDWSGTERALLKVPPGSPAAAMAGQLRDETRRRSAPWVGLEVHHFYDTQPLEHMSERLAARLWPYDGVELSASQEMRVVLRLPPPVPVRRYAQDLGARLLVLDANVSLGIRGGAAVWDDDEVQWFGGVNAELRWWMPVVLTLGAVRSEVLVTQASIAEHILVDTSGATLALRDYEGWNGELHWERRAWSDANDGRAAYAWATAPLLQGDFSLHAGYAGSFANTRQNRWDADAQRYSPYFTPFNEWRHGPVVALGLALWRVNLGVKGSLALQSEDDDPNSEEWGVVVRRDTQYMNIEGRAAVDLGLGELSIGRGFTRQYYYDSHDTWMKLEMLLP